MRRRITVLVVAVLAAIGLSASPAGAEDLFDCEGKVALFCPGPVPW